MPLRRGPQSEHADTVRSRRGRNARREDADTFKPHRRQEDGAYARRQSAADHVNFAALDRPLPPAPRVMAEAARRNAKGKQRAPVDDVRLATRSLAASVG